MYKSTQHKGDFIGRTGTHATRFSLRQYAELQEEYLALEVSNSDVNRLRLNEAKSERERLLAQAASGQNLMAKLRQAGEQDAAAAIGRKRMGICFRMGELNSYIKRENFRLHSLTDQGLLIRAMRMVLDEATVNKIFALKIELEGQVDEHTGIDARTAIFNDLSLGQGT